MTPKEAAYDEADNVMKKRRSLSKQVVEEHEREIFSRIPEIEDIHQKRKALCLELVGIAFAPDRESRKKQINEAIGVYKTRENVLLETFGYPTDYLTEKPFCEKCKDQGSEPFSAGRCECFMFEVKKSLCKRIDNGIHNRELTFETYTIGTEYQRNAFNASKFYAENFADNLKAGKGLIFEGTAGTGKTHLATSICLKLLEGYHTVICKTGQTLLGDIKRTFDGGGVSEDYVLDEYKSVDLLVIDDIDKIRITEWGLSMLFDIVNARNDMKKPIIVTSNRNGKALLVRLTPQGSDDDTDARALLSRIHQNAKTITMSWEDYRMGGKRYA
jgi:DNA replication protein DnaC